MKSITTALQILFATRQYQVAGLYTFSLIGGGTLNYCSGDGDIYWNSTLYSCGGSIGPFFDRKDNKAKLHQKIGTAVDQLTFDVIPGTYTISGEPFLSFVRQGGFDGAELTFSRAYWSMNTATNNARQIVPVGTIICMVGRVAEVDCGRSIASFTVNSHLELLNIQMPRNLYQSGCVNTLFDHSCTLAMSSYAVNGTVSSGSTASQVNATLSQASRLDALDELAKIFGKTPKTIQKSLTRYVDIFKNCFETQLIVNKEVQKESSILHKYTVCIKKKDMTFDSRSEAIEFISKNINVSLYAINSNPTFYMDIKIRQNFTMYLVKNFK